jgi:hypothetical protein
MPVAHDVKYEDSLYILGIFSLFLEYNKIINIIKKVHLKYFILLLFFIRIFYSIKLII